MLAYLAAGIGDRQRDAARVAGAGLMITSASRKRLPWGRIGSDMSNLSVKERGAPNGSDPARFCTLSWLTFWIFTD
jgi:hypothetical protein